MSESTFKIIFSGQTSGGLSVDEVKTNLASAFKLSDKHLDKLFAGKEVVVKKGLSREVGQKIQMAFARAGAVSIMRENADAASEIPTEPDTAPTPSETANNASLPFLGGLNAAQKKLLMMVGGGFGIASFFAIVLVVAVPRETTEHSSLPVTDKQVARGTLSNSEKDICDNPNFQTMDYQEYLLSPCFVHSV